jgi:putative sugar O-methyltransferase
MLQFIVRNFRKNFTKISFFFARKTKKYTEYLKQVLIISGIRGFKDDLNIKFREWSLNGSHFNVQNDSSLSDTYDYRLICKLAVESEEIFDKFARNREYRAILEHVTREQGFEYLNSIKNKDVKSLIPKLQEINLGNPFKFYYRGIGMVSPTYLRYLKVLDDLKNIFGNLDNFCISEVGAGYGGQAVVIDRLFKIKSYSIYDLPYSCDLIKKYTERLGTEMPFSFYRDAIEHTSEIDLFISNYAFSELKRDIQISYLNNLISKSKRGYVIYNHITKGHFDSMDANEFITRIDGAEIFVEKPLTFSGNHLVIWGH